jgi:hypothetical protein
MAAAAAAAAGLGQDHVDQLEWQVTGQLTEMTGREHPGGDADGAGQGRDGGLDNQRDLR